MRDDNVHPGDDSQDDDSQHDPRAVSAVGRLMRGAESAAEPIVGGVSAALGAAANSLGELPGARVRRLRRLGRIPLPSLPHLYPEAARARPMVIGLRSIPLDQICGTAAGGGDQRGSDFLPLKPFRGKNWQARWQRLRKAQDSLAILPPIDVEKYADCYWVVDGHNRVALALYNNQDEIDASVVELVPFGGRRTEQITSLEAEVDAARSVRRLTQTEGIGHPHSRPDDEPT